MSLLLTLIIHLVYFFSFLRCCSAIFFNKNPTKIWTALQSILHSIKVFVVVVSSVFCVCTMLSECPICLTVFHKKRISFSLSLCVWAFVCSFNAVILLCSVQNCFCISTLRSFFLSIPFQSLFFWLSLAPHPSIHPL